LSLSPNSVDEPVSGSRNTASCFVGWVKRACERGPPMRQLELDEMVGPRSQARLTHPTRLLQISCDCVKWGDAVSSQQNCSPAAAAGVLQASTSFPPPNFHIPSDG